MGKEFTKSGGGMATKGVNPFAKFEKSGKDVEKKGVKEGSKKDMAMDKKAMPKFAAGGSIKASPMGKVTAGGIKKFGEHSVQTKGHTKGKNLGDSGKTVGIMSGGKRGR